MSYREAPPPDFRYVGLAPGLSPLHMAAAAAGASTSLAGALLLAAGPDVASVAVSMVAGGMTALTLRGRGAFRLFKHGYARPAAMAIVPWGILVHPDDERETVVLRWAGVRSIHVDSIHTRDASGSPQTTWSFVTVETERVRLLGRTAGHAPLERLMAHLPSYARESSSRVALDLEGNEAGGDGVFEPVMGELLERVRHFLSTAEGAEALSLDGATYRQVAAKAAKAATAETAATLRRALQGAGGEADGRAFAALAAGELGEASLLPDLLRLVMAAHPATAAAAKAAALRLGAEPTKTGALDEVAPFVHEEDLAALRRWVARGEEAGGSVGL